MANCIDREHTVWPKDLNVISYTLGSATATKQILLTEVSHHAYLIADFISVPSVTTCLTPWSVANSVSMMHTQFAQGLDTQCQPTFISDFHEVHP